MRTWLTKLLLVSTVALTLLPSGWAQYKELSQRLDKMPDAQVLVEAKENPELKADQDIKSLLYRASSVKTRAQEIREIVRTWTWANNFDPQSTDQSVAQKAKQQKIYSDRASKSSSNWLQKALSTLQFRPNMDSEKKIAEAVPGFLNGTFIVQLMWGLLFLGIIGLVVYAARLIKTRNLWSRKARALLDEDEPERTVDEWLEMADRLSQEGKHREAVRCLFLAMLLRFDEAKVARFVRSETNWEHLHRIEASPKLPPEIVFRPLCQKFDQIWYGFRTEGEPDVARFRTAYTQITEVLAAVKS